MPSRKPQNIGTTPAPVADPPEQAPPPPKRVLYFINEQVEDLLRRYIWTGCTDVRLRDAIMAHAPELIRQVIRKQGLHTIYPGQEESSFGDLVSTAWGQIERVLYKFRAKPHCRPCYNPNRPDDSALYLPGELEYGVITLAELRKKGISRCPRCNVKLADEPIVVAAQDTYGGSETILYRGESKVFNMWSQISRTVILAHIKKESRDRKNSSSYRDYIENRPKLTSDLYISTSDESGKIKRQPGDRISRFLAEAREKCKFSDNHLLILDTLEHLIDVDEKPWDGIIGKLVEHSGLSRPLVTQFLEHIQLLSFDFTDSVISRTTEQSKLDKRRTCSVDFDED